GVDRHRVAGDDGGRGAKRTGGRARGAAAHPAREEAGGGGGGISGSAPPTPPPAPGPGGPAPPPLRAPPGRAGAPGAPGPRVGMGPRRAAGGADIAREAVGRPVMIAGFCGALDPSLGPGEIVLASELRGPTGTTPCADATILAGVLGRAGLRVRVGPIASSQR